MHVQHNRDKIHPQLEDSRKVTLESLMCVKTYMTQCPLANVVIHKHLWMNSLEKLQVMYQNL